jgi:hypothetical protein
VASEVRLDPLHGLEEPAGCGPVPDLRRGRDDVELPVAPVVEERVRPVPIGVTDRQDLAQSEHHVIGIPLGHGAERARGKD